jgi:hypothetical protein
MQRFLKKKGSKIGTGTAKKSYYVTRDSKGRIKKWVQVGRSLRADNSKPNAPAVNTPKKKRQGNQGDYVYKGQKRTPGQKFIKSLFS